MLIELIRFAGATEIGLTVVEGTGRFHGVLPLCGPSIAQAGLLFCLAVLIHEAGELAKAVRRRIRARRRAARG